MEENPQFKASFRENQLHRKERPGYLSPSSGYEFRKSGDTCPACLYHCLLKEIAEFYSKSHAYLAQGNYDFLKEALERASA